MSNKALNSVWPLKMPAPAKAVLVAIADRVNDSSGKCWPTVADLVERTCLSKRAVLNAVHALEGNKAISVERSHRKPNVYRVTAGRFGAWVHEVHPARRAPNRVHEVHSVGAPGAPQPSVNPQIEPSMLADASLGERVFLLGGQLLTESGRSKSAAGSLLAKLRNQHGDVAVLKAIEAARREHVSDPAAWLVKTCRSAAVHRKSLAIGDQDYDAGWNDAKNAKAAA